MSAPPPLPTSASPRRPAEYLFLNLSFPGVGSYQAGRRVTGLLQASVAATGFVLTNVFAFWFCRLWYLSGEFPVLTLLRAEVLPRSWLRPFLFGLAGVTLFIIALVWALFTSLAIVRHPKE